LRKSIPVDRTHNFFKEAEKKWLPLSFYCYLNYLQKEVLCKCRYKKFHAKQEELSEACLERTPITDIDTLMIKTEFVIKERFDSE
jgi:hypothetical protein